MLNIRWTAQVSEDGATFAFFKKCMHVNYYQVSHLETRISGLWTQSDAASGLRESSASSLLLLPAAAAASSSLDHVDDSFTFSSTGCNPGFLIWDWERLLLFLLERYWWMACMTPEGVQRWHVRASCSVNGPSLVRLTPVHAAVLRSSSPISCTTLRKYLCVSLRHCTSVGRREKKNNISIGFKSWNKMLNVFNLRLFT